MGSHDNAKDQTGLLLSSFLTGASSQLAGKLRLNQYGDAHKDAMTARLKVFGRLRRGCTAKDGKGDVSSVVMFW